MCITPLFSALQWIGFNDSADEETGFALLQVKVSIVSLLFFIIDIHTRAF